MSSEEFDDPQREAEWLTEQRADVLEYLAGAGVPRADVPHEPAWCEPPYVAVWPVGSNANPGAVGWWVISGDVPPDYISSSEIRGARAGLRAFSLRWSRAARGMATGEAPEGLVIGAPAEWKSLAPMLASCATLLGEWANDDELWP